MPLSTNKVTHTPPSQIRRTFLSIFKKVEHQMTTPENIYRKNQYGLAQEQIDFFRHSSKIKNHRREYLPKNGNPGKKTTINFSIDDGKRYLSELFSNKYYGGSHPIETNIRNYTKDKKLTSKVKAYFGQDKGGQFEVKTITTYEPGCKKPSSVSHEKRYLKKDDDRKTPENYTRITTLFDDNGKRTFEKKEDAMGWSTCEFDETGASYNHKIGSFRTHGEDYSENLL